mmetsp:Transcript_40855/g.80501  ORF Transcript_40855/g.80501 Transcript_40855/m.80501 type:complete len:125 (+) Transcript_40855:848-1222(+)
MPACLSYFVSVCVYVCVSVFERERERFFALRSFLNKEIDCERSRHSVVQRRKASKHLHSFLLSQVEVIRIVFLFLPFAFDPDGRRSLETGRSRSVTFCQDGSLWLFGRPASCTSSLQMECCFSL